MRCRTDKTLYKCQVKINTTSYAGLNLRQGVELLKQNEVTNKLMTFNQLWDFGLSSYIGEYGEQPKNDLLRTTITDKKIVVKTEKQAINRIWKGEKESIGNGIPKKLMN